MNKDFIIVATETIDDGTGLTVMSKPKPRYPFIQGKGADKTAPIEGYSVTLGSSTCFENFNVKLPVSFGPKAESFKVRDRVTLVGGHIGIYGKSEKESTFTDLELSISADDLKPVQAKAV